MRRVLLLWSFVALACSHDIDIAQLEIDRLNGEARASMERNDLWGARESYAQVVTYDGDQRESAAGWALADFLLLLDSLPARAFLDRCNQPYFDIETAVFGTDGLLAKEDRANLGTATLTTTYRPMASGSEATLPWNTPTVRTEIVAETNNAVTSDYLKITVRDPTSERALELELNYADLFAGDGAQTPLMPGLGFDLGPNIDGSLSLFQSQNASASLGERTATGRIRFDAVNNAGGDRVALEIIDAVLPGWCLEEPCTAEYRVAGRIEDEVTEISIPEEQYPFGTIRADEGPPFAQELIVALERCGELDDEFLALAIRELGHVLALEADRFHNASAGDLSYALPKQLLHIDRDLPFNEADAAAFEAVASGAAAALDLASRYRYFEGTLQALVKTFTRNGSQVRDFHPEDTVRNLKANLLEPRADFTLDLVRARLHQSLRAVRTALTLEPEEREGIFNFRALPIRSLAEAYASFAEDLDRSIESDEPIVPEAAPEWRLHLRRFFDDPLTRQNVTERLGVDLVSTSSNTYSVEIAPELASQWASLFGDAIVTPEEGETPFIFSEAALKSLSDQADGDWPHFINTLLRDALEFSF